MLIYAIALQMFHCGSVKDGKPQHAENPNRIVPLPDRQRDEIGKPIQCRGPFSGIYRAQAASCADISPCRGSLCKGS